MFFAPIVSPPPPSPPSVVVVDHAPAPVVVTGSVPRALLNTSVALPKSYSYGACQAIHYVAWTLRWSFAGDCALYNRSSPMPLRYGVPAPAWDWLRALAQQLPPTARVVVQPQARLIAVTPRDFPFRPESAYDQPD